MAFLNLVRNAFSNHYIGLSALRWPVRTGPQPVPQAFTGYNYRFVLFGTNRTYGVSNLDVATDVTKGCCGCPTNTRRRFVLNGNAVIAESGASETALRR